MAFFCELDVPVNGMIGVYGSGLNGGWDIFVIYCNVQGVGFEARGYWDFGIFMVWLDWVR